MSELGKLLREKLQPTYKYFNGGDEELKELYLKGSVVEFRTNSMTDWIKVSPANDDIEVCRVSNKFYHFRVLVTNKTLYAYVYPEGEYLGLDNTEEHNPLTNLVVSLENGRITNVMYVGP